MTYLRQIISILVFIFPLVTVNSMTGEPGNHSVLNSDTALNVIRTRVAETRLERSYQNKAFVDSIRQIVKGFPVTGVMNDTVFYIYSKLGASTPAERAEMVTRKIRRVYQDDFFRPDSIFIQHSDYTVDVVYRDIILIGVSELDALWYGKSMDSVAAEFKTKIDHSILLARENFSLVKLLLRIGLVLTVILTTIVIIWLIGKGSVWLLNFISKNRVRWLRSLSYRDYTFLSAEQEFSIIEFLARILRWVLYAILLYISLPVIFSIFPFTRGWADSLVSLVWDPLKGILTGIWRYVPDLISILVILFVMKYVLKVVKYIFVEIEEGKLTISGFHADWAMPTFTIARFLLYAFTFVLIFPHLPGSDSAIFKGVSVFIGVLFSLGSPSVIANTVAGLVITYMRPFKIGDRIRIGDITGDVIEKTMLVTRLKTIKNEEITIPNTSVLTGSTTNFSSFAGKDGLILYTTVTIGYDVPWRDMHKALIDAALQTDLILTEPAPFILQTSLGDFYVSYQLNAYTRDAAKMVAIYSELHQNIQDVCNERGIEIMSPHYHAKRDGNMTTIPASYLPGDYKAPAFNIRIEKDKD